MKKLDLLLITAIALIMSITSVKADTAVIKTLSTRESTEVSAEQIQLAEARHVFYESGEYKFAGASNQNLVAQRNAANPKINANDRRIFFKLDTNNIPENANIMSATLKLTINADVTNTVSGSKIYCVPGATSNWNTSDVTNANNIGITDDIWTLNGGIEEGGLCLTHDSNGNGSVTAQYGKVGMPVFYDITNLISTDGIYDGNGSYTLMLSTMDNQPLTVASPTHEREDYRPYIDIQYAVGISATYETHVRRGADETYPLTGNLYQIQTQSSPNNGENDNRMFFNIVTDGIPVGSTINSAEIKYAVNGVMGGTPSVTYYYLPNLPEWTITTSWLTGTWSTTTPPLPQATALTGTIAAKNFFTPTNETDFVKMNTAPIELTTDNAKGDIISADLKAAFGGADGIYRGDRQYSFLIYNSTNSGLTIARNSPHNPQNLRPTIVIDYTPPVIGEQPDEITVTGETTAKIPLNGAVPTLIQLTVTSFKDQFEIADAYSCTVVDAPSGVSVGQTGLVTVTGAASEGEITVQVRSLSGGDAVGQHTLTLSKYTPQDFPEPISSKMIVHNKSEADVTASYVSNDAIVGVVEVYNASQQPMDVMVAVAGYYGTQDSGFKLDDTPNTVLGAQYERRPIITVPKTIPAYSYAKIRTDENSPAGKVECINFRRPDMPYFPVTVKAKLFVWENFESCVSLIDYKEVSNSWTE